MTITSVRVYDPLEVIPPRSSGQNSPKAPLRIWTASDPPFKGYHAPPTEGFKQSSPDTAIVIDNGMTISTIAP
jgi:actin-related protein 5